MNRHVLEVVAAITTGLLKFVFMGWLQWQPFYIGTAIIGWGSYIAYRVWQNRSILQKWGFTRTNLRQSFTVISFFALLSFIGFLIWGKIHGTLKWHPHLTLSLVVYPIWGLIQQFLILALVAGNLHDLESEKWTHWRIVAFTTFLFGIVHLPNIPLTIATTSLAVFYTVFYLRWRNLWPLGLYHGWLGAFFYFWVLEQNVWTNVFK